MTSTSLRGDLARAERLRAETRSLSMAGILDAYLAIMRPLVAKVEAEQAEQAAPEPSP